MKNLAGILAQQPLSKNPNGKQIHVLLEENQPASKFFLVQEGEVALESSRQGAGYFTVQTVSHQEPVGWSWLFPPFTNHFRARAAEPVKAIAIDGARLLAHCENDHEFGHAVMKCIVPILVERLQHTRADHRAERAEWVNRFGPGAVQWLG